MSANGGKDRNNSALIVALATGKTYREAAAAAHVSERTVERRMADQAFRAQVAEARGEMVDRAVGQASDSMADAITTLQTLMRSAESDSVKLRAARTILEFGGGRHPLNEAVSRTFMLSISQASQIISTVVEVALDYIPGEAQAHFIARVRSAAQ